MDRIKHYQEPFQNIYETLEHSTQKYPDKIAMADDERAVSYRQLLKEADEFANIIEGLGIRTQQQVGFVMVNSIRMAACFYGAMKCGCIAVLVNTKLKKEEIRKLLQEMEIKALFCDERWKDKVEDAAEQLGINDIITEKTSWKRAAPFNPHCIRNLDNAAVIMHTSGTTGNPKGVMITHRNILEAAYGYREVQGLNSDAVTVLSVQLVHILGLSCVTTYFIYMGATVVLTAFYDAAKVLKSIKEWKATHFHSVPTVYHQLILSYGSDDDLSSLRVAVCGGAPIQKEKIEEFSKLAPNASFRLAYGMTETAGSGALSHEHCKPLKAVKNVHIQIENPHGKTLNPYERGEIVFYGPVVARGRWNAKGLNEERMPSGDIGYMDREGNLFVLGRIKDMISRGGEKVFPSEIESVLLEYPGVAQASVVGIKDEEYGELPAAVVIPKPGRSIDSEELRGWMKKRTATFKMPCMFEIWNALPLTQNGKIRKTEIRRILEEMRDGNEKAQSDYSK